MLQGIWSAASRGLAIKLFNRVVGQLLVAIAHGEYMKYDLLSLSLSIYIYIYLYLYIYIYISLSLSLSLAAFGTYLCKINTYIYIYIYQKNNK